MQVLDDRYRALRLLRLNKPKECLELCRNAMGALDVSSRRTGMFTKSGELSTATALDLIRIRAQTCIALVPDYLVQSNDLDIVDQSMQKSFTSGVKTGMIKTAREKTAMARGPTARKSLTRQALTAKRTTAAIRQTATRMKTAAIRKATKDEELGNETVSRFPELCYDFYFSSMRYRMALDVAVSYDSHWWYMQQAKAMYMMSDYKGCLDVLRQNDDDLESIIYNELLISTHRKLGIALPTDIPENIDLQLLQVQLQKLSSDAGTLKDFGEKLCSAILSVDSTNLDALLGLAAAHIEKTPELAMLLYLRTFKLYPANARLFANIGLAALFSNALDIAGTCFERALRQDLTNFDADVYSAIAYLFILTGDLVSADLCYHVGSLLGQLDARSLNNWAIIRDHGSDYDGARDQFLKAIVISEFGVDMVDHDQIVMNAFKISHKHGDYKQCLGLVQNLDDRAQQLSLLRDKMKHFL